MANNKKVTADCADYTDAAIFPRAGKWRWLFFSKSALICVICGFIPLSGCSVIPNPLNPGVRMASAELDPPRGWCTAGWFDSGLPWRQLAIVWACKDDAGAITYESPEMSESTAPPGASDILGAAESAAP
ncbi:MAG: hypothetical protein ACREQI_11110 [Candidatus Binataceae bacterium]